MIPVPSRLGGGETNPFSRVTAKPCVPAQPAGAGASPERSAHSLSLLSPEVINEMQALC